MDYETSARVVVGAVILAKLTGWALGLAILDAMWRAVSPGTHAWVGARALAVLRFALRALCLVGLFVHTLPEILASLAVTYLHTYRADKATTKPEADGRHAAGFGRALQRAGQHRAKVA